MAYSSLEQVTSQIRERGFRLTSQRMAILGVLYKTGERLLPLEIFEKASALQPGITEPTLYRTLDFLVENGFVSVVTRGRRLVYELMRSSHYLMICSSCGSETEMGSVHHRGERKSMSGKLYCGYFCFIS